MGEHELPARLNDNDPSLESQEEVLDGEIVDDGEGYIAPVTPDEARAGRRAETSGAYKELNERLREAIKVNAGTAFGTAASCTDIPPDVTERVVREWRAAGWTKARVRTDRLGSTLQLD